MATRMNTSSLARLTNLNTELVETCQRLGTNLANWVRTGSGEFREDTEKTFFAISRTSRRPLHLPAPLGGAQVNTADSLVYISHGKSLPLLFIQTSSHEHDSSLV